MYGSLIEELSNIIKFWKSSTIAHWEIMKILLHWCWKLIVFLIRIRRCHGSDVKSFWSIFWGITSSPCENIWSVIKAMVYGFSAVRLIEFVPMFEMFIIRTQRQLISICGHNVKDIEKIVLLSLKNSILWKNISELHSIFQVAVSIKSWFGYGL